jgi:hypothetical protein
MGTKGAGAGLCLPCRAALGWGVAGCRTHPGRGKEAAQRDPGGAAGKLEKVAVPRRVKQACLRCDLVRLHQPLTHR